MSKSKSPLPVYSEIHFMSSLPLEDSVRLVSGLASARTRVTLTEVSPDAWEYDIEQRMKIDRVKIAVTGVLRRWEGTLTRVDCRTFAAEPERKLLGRWFMANLIYSLLLFLRYLLDPSFPYESTQVAVLGLLAIVTWVTYFFALTFMGESQAMNTRKYAADALLNEIVSTFKAAGTLSLDAAQQDTALNMPEAEMSLPAKSKS